MDYANELAKIIDVVSKKLGVAADKIMPILYKQINYVVLIDAIWAIGAIIAIVFFTKLILKNKSKAKVIEKHWGDDEINAPYLTCILSSICLIVCIVIVYSSTREILQATINPEYFIYKEYILSLMK